MAKAEAAFDPAELDAKEANIRYHDWEASQYDGKWSISFDERCIEYAREKFTKIAPDRRYGDVLEIGTGTGFFIVNLWQAGLVERASATDISPGMVEACRRNAKAVGLDDIDARPADAEALPFPDNSFDLVVGHAVLHHLPDVPAALAEAYRVLRPGGLLVIAGEPTRLGFQIVLRARRATARGYKLFAKVAPGDWIRDEEIAQHDDPAAALEQHVDLHEFHPHMVKRWLREAGFDRPRVETEEFISALSGWSVRTIEALARPGLLGAGWAQFAYRSYLALYRLDHAVTRHVLPKALFYNLLLSAEKPADG